MFKIQFLFGECKTKLEIFQIFLISIIPILLITGPFLSDMTVVLVSAIFIYEVLKNKDFNVFNNIYFKFFILFYLYLVFNSIINFENFNSFKTSLVYIRFGFFFSALIYYLEKNNKLLYLILYSLFFSFTVLIFDSFIQFFFNKNILGFEQHQIGRVSSFFGEELILGSYLSRLFPIYLGISFLLFSNNRFIINLIFLSLIVINLIILLSGERVAIFLSLLGLFYIIILSNGFKLIKFISLISSIILIAFVSFNNLEIKNRIIDHTINQLNLGKSNLKFFSNQHEMHFTSALRMFNDNKIIGVGVKNYRNFCRKEKYIIDNDYRNACSTHPHNTYIQLLSETGFIGFIFIFSIFCTIFFMSIKHCFFKFYKKKYIYSNSQICFMSALIITLWPIIPSGNFFNNWLSIIYYYPIGILFWSLKSKQNFFL